MIYDLNIFYTTMLFDFKNAQHSVLDMSITSHSPSAGFRQAMQFCVICSGGGQLEHSAALRCWGAGDKSVRKLLNPSRLCSNQLRQAQYFSSISTLSSSSVVKSLQNINIIFPKQKLSARCHHCQDCKTVYSIFASIFTVNG